MKARVFKTESQIRRIVQDEAKRQTTQIYDAAIRDATYQAYAVMMCVCCIESLVSAENG